MGWQDWLIRAVVGVAAGGVSTGVIVATAENGPGLKRKKRRKKRRRPRTPAEQREYERRKKKAKRNERKRRREEDALLEPGTMAALHLRATSQPGLTPKEFLENVKESGKSAKNRVGRWFGLLPPEAPPAHGDPAPASRRRPRHGARPDRGARSTRYARQEGKDGYDTLKEEAFHLAKDAVKRKAVEAIGVSDKIEALKDTAEDIQDVAVDVAARIKDGVADGAGVVGEAASQVGRKAGALANSVMESIPDDALENVGGGMKNFGRWLQGPGAQDYDHQRNPGPRRLGTGAAANGESTTTASAGVGERAIPPWRRKRLAERGEVGERPSTTASTPRARLEPPSSGALVRPMTGQPPERGAPRFPAPMFGVLSPAAVPRRRAEVPEVVEARIVDDPDAPMPSPRASVGGD